MLKRSSRIRQFALAMVALLATAFPAMAGIIVADYTTVPDGTYASVFLNGTTVTGSSNVVSALFSGNRGLGIQGGGSDVSLDLAETMTVSFGQLVTNVTLKDVDIDPPGNVTSGFTAFNGTTNLGFFAIPNHVSGVVTHDLTLLAGGLQFTSFRLSLSASAPLGLQIQEVTYDVAAVAAVPEPGTLTLLGIGIAGMAGYGWRRKKLVVA